TRDSAPPTADLLRLRIQEAARRRVDRLVPNSAVRLVFGEADLLPSIIVDAYSRYLVLQTLSRGSDSLKELLVPILVELFQPLGIVERNDLRARRLEGLPESSNILWGEVPQAVTIEERGILFEVDLLHGQKTGFFLDQSENRHAAAGHARGDALDCFTHSGGFALHFARVCESVLGVDLSAPALEQARHNARLNNLSNVEFHEANVFDYLRELDRSRSRFDTICLDPPAFAKSRRALAGALGGYKEINLRAIRLLRPGGVLVTCSCSYHLGDTVFEGLLNEALHDARRYAQVVERRSQAGDHPVLASMPETRYLKCLILRVL
ncbi:MAG: class I SAM-dependent rRNA methyltransferase, partial [Acidobacteria bacterium]|nr:class I SAM-dependent rRNA methyltransferase [Acidobacteriota bacterium]